MTRFAIDAPTLLHLVREDVVINPGHRLVAPNVLRSDALGLLFDEVRRGELDEVGALAQLERLTELKVRLLGDRVSRRTAWKLAREHGWDDLRHAEYLAVARLQADALVTVDDELAGRADGIVELAPMTALTEE